MLRRLWHRLFGHRMFSRRHEPQGFYLGTQDGLFEIDTSSKVWKSRKVSDMGREG